MLEIGASAGYFLNEARKVGFEVYAIEINNVQADFIRSKLGIPCEESSLNSSSFGGKNFDICYHCDIISHFHDPILEFKKMNDCLKDKGILVFETGNLGDVKEKYYRIFTKFQFPDHLFFFSEDNLKELLRRTGFEFMEIYRYSILPQLLIIKTLGKVIEGFKSRVKIKGTSKNNITKAISFNIPKSCMRRFSFKQLIKNIYHYFHYLARYKIGYVMPKKGQPQTVIIIARKGK